MHIPNLESMTQEVETKALGKALVKDQLLMVGSFTGTVKDLKISGTDMRKILEQSQHPFWRFLDESPGS